MSDTPFTWAHTVLETTAVTFQPLKAEASSRAFYRVESTDRAPDDDSATAVLMVSPPETEQNAQFERLARVFADHALPVPAILARDSRAGWYLLSDLGRTDLAAVYGTAEEDDALELAIETLIRLQHVQSPDIPPYTAERFTDELGIFREWFAGKLAGLTLPATVSDVFGQLVERTRSQRVCCVHRDYHCRNLLYDPLRRQLGIVDFQDALMGPVSYDLASLLHDCYHEFGNADVERWIDFYLARSDFDLDTATFRQDVDYLAVQRQLKAVGIFARLRLRDSKTSHLVHIPPVLAHLRLLARRHAALMPLADWLDGLDHAAIATRLADLRAP